MDEAAKRKRLSDPEGQPDAKRPAQDQQQPAITKDPRAALAEVYAAYDALHRNAYTDDKDIKAGEAHFAVLLSALQGKLPTRLFLFIFSFANYWIQLSNKRHHPLPAFLRINT